MDNKAAVNPRARAGVKAPAPAPIADPRKSVTGLRASGAMGNAGGDTHRTIMGLKAK